MRDITDFVGWLAGDTRTSAGLHVLQAVTGVDFGDAVDPEADINPYDFAGCVLLVEDYGLRDVLSLAATTPTWWRIVTHWDRIVNALNSETPGWRNGAFTRGEHAANLLAGMSTAETAPRRVLLDMDGPLADFDRQFWDVAVENGVEFDIETLDQQTHRYLTEHISDPEQRALARSIADTPGWYRELPITVGAQEGVESIIAAGHDVWVATKPRRELSTCCDEKIGWLAEHFPSLADRYIMTSDKACVAGDILVDDAIVHTQADVALWNPVVFRLPFNRPGSEWGRYPSWGWEDPVERLSW